MLMPSANMEGVPELPQGRPCLPLWLPPQGQPGFLVAPSQWLWEDVLGLEKSPLHALLLKRETEGGGPDLRNKGVAMVTSEESNSSPLRADGRVRQLAPQPGQGRLAGCHGDSQADQVLQFFWGPGQDQLRVPQSRPATPSPKSPKAVPVQGTGLRRAQLTTCFFTLSVRALCKITSPAGLGISTQAMV